METKHLLRACLGGVVLGWAGLVAVPALATSLVWNDHDGAGAWDTATASWTGGGTVFTDGGVDDVTFSNTAGGTITISANMTPVSTTVSAASGTYTFSGGPIDGGTLVKSGGGTLDLRDTLTNGFTAITLGGGIVQFDQRQPGATTVNQLGAGPITVTENSTLSYAYNTVGGVGGTVSNATTINAGKTLTLTREVGQHYPAYSGKISGSGALRIESTLANYWSITNSANDFSGGITIAGTGWFQNDGALGNNSVIHVEAGRQFWFTGSMGAGKTVNLLGNANMLRGTWNGVVQGNGFGVSMSDGTLGLNNANNSQAWTFNNIGTLRIGVPGSLGPASAYLSYTSNPNNYLEFFDAVGGTFPNELRMSTGDNRTLKVENAGATITWTGKISGNGTAAKFVYKDGPGTFVTTDWQANNSLTIKEGRFLVNDPDTAGMGNVTVKSGAVLGGTGQIEPAVGNSVTVEAGGILAPGASAGTLSVAGNLVMASGSTAFLEFAGTGAGQFDALTVTGGTLNLSAAGDILDVTILAPYYSQVGDSFRILNATSVSGEFDIVRWNGWTTGSVYTVTYDPDGAVLEFLVSIPEPGALVLLAAGAVLAGARRRH